MITNLTVLMSPTASASVSLIDASNQTSNTTLDTTLADAVPLKCWMGAESPVKGEVGLPNSEYCVSFTVQCLVPSMDPDPNFCKTPVESAASNVSSNDTHTIDIFTSVNQTTLDDIANQSDLYDELFYCQ